MTWRRSGFGARCSAAVLFLLLASCGYQAPDGADSGSTGSADSELRSIGGQHELAGWPRASGAELAASALDGLRARRGVLGLSSTLDDFAVLSSHRGLDGLDHVRLQQLHRGVPVWGADVVVHASADAFHGVGGELGSIADIDPIAGVASELAIETVKADRIRAADGGDPPWFGRERHELVIFPAATQPARLTWHVSLFTDNERGTRPAWWNYFIDAHDGSIVHSFNGLETVLANGPGGNARVSRTWSTLQVTQNGSLYVMSNPALETHDDQHANGTGGCDTVHQCAHKGVVAFDVNANGVFQSSTLTFSDPAGNDAHGFAGVVLSMLQNLFGLNSINNAGFQITPHVHYKTNFANAFWDPGTDQLYFGDGDGVEFYAFSGAIEVVAHEIHHGFTQFHSALHFDTTPAGGLNESFSDIAGATARFYGDLAPTFDYGDKIMVQPNVALRYMCDPTRDGFSIDNAANFVAGMDPHYSSGVMNKAFCRAAKRISGADPDTGQATLAGVSRAARAWYAANMSYWTSAPSFVDACQGVVSAAEAVGLSASDVAGIGRSWQDVGVNCRFPVAWLAGNMDIDQQTDLIEVFDNGAGHAGLRVYRSTGTGYAASFSSSDLGQPSSALAWLSGTVNAGDQLTDVIQLSNNAGQLRITVYRSTGSGYTLDSITDTGRSPAALAWLTGDVDHDGLTDIIQPFDNAGRLGIAVYSPGPTGYRVNTVTSDVGQGSGALAWLTGHMTDQMSTDVIQPFDNGGNLGLLVYKWTPAGYATAFGSSNMAHSSSATRWLTVDVTQNQRTSIVQVATDPLSGELQLFTYVSSGTSYSLSSVGSTGRFETPLTWLTANVDGDSATDLIQLFDNNGTLGLIVYLWNGVAYQTNSITPLGTTMNALGWFTGSMTGASSKDILEPFYTAPGTSPTLGLDVYRVNANGVGYNVMYTNPNLGPVN